jgi:16S rRNA processing protein RimM
MAEDRQICVGQFAGAHGVRGLVRLRSFTEDPEAIFSYAPLVGADGKHYKIARKSVAKDHFLVTVEGVTTKEEADALRGDQIFIARAQLPETKDGEYYDADLIGLKAFDAEGRAYGEVFGIYDHGGGPFLEIGTTRKDSFMLPFKDAFVPDVDVAGGKICIVLPDGWL